MRKVWIGLCALLLLAGCSSVQTRTFAQPATGERVFGNIKRVAVLPFDTLSEGAVGPKNAENVLIQELSSLEVFEEGLEETRYVNGLMKKLKLRNTESLDRELVRKIGEELQVDGVVVGALMLFGQEETSEIVEFSIFLGLIEVETGDLIWSGRTFVRSSTTASEVFGLSAGPSVNELATEGIVKLAREMASQVEDARELEVEKIFEMGQEKEEEPTEEEVPAEEQKKEEEQAEEILLKVKPK